MAQHAYRKYVEDEILAADPISLVRLLYDGAIGAVAQAREHLRAGDIRARAGCVMKASAIVNELNAALDHELGGEISRRLAEIYEYVQRKLFDGNFHQTDRPFEEAESLLRTLSVGWQVCQEPKPSAHRSPAPLAAYAFTAEPEYQPLSYAG